MVGSVGGNRGDTCAVGARPGDVNAAEDRVTLRLFEPVVFLNDVLLPVVVDLSCIIAAGRDAILSTAAEWLPGRFGAVPPPPPSFMRSEGVAGAINPVSFGCGCETAVLLLLALFIAVAVTCGLFVISCVCCIDSCVALLATPDTTAPLLVLLTLAPALLPWSCQCAERSCCCCLSIIASFCCRMLSGDCSLPAPAAGGCCSKLLLLLLLPW